MDQRQKRVRATDLKNNLGQYLEAAILGSNPLFVEKHGQSVAVLIGIEQWKKLVGQQVPSRSLWVAACRSLAGKIQGDKTRKQTPAVQLIRELRHQS